MLERFLPTAMTAMGSNNSSNPFANGVAQFASGAFGDSGKPYELAENTYKPYVGKAEEAFNPFVKAGQSAIPQYQNWLSGMKDPSQFINMLMNHYQQSPWAKFQTQQGVNASNNAASANGLIGSSALGRANADYARNISSQDMNQWLQNVLGINSQYGSGTSDIFHTGYGASTGLGNLYNTAGKNIAELEYAQEQGDQQDFSNMTGGLSHILFG